MTAYSGSEREKLDKIVMNMKAIFRIYGPPAFLHRSIHLYYPLSGDCVPGGCQHHCGCSVPDDQQKTGRRYQTPDPPGSHFTKAFASLQADCVVYGLPGVVAAVSSLFGVRALFTGTFSSRTRGTVPEMLLVSATMILLLCVIEYIYMRVVKHSSDRYL